MGILEILVILLFLFMTAFLGYLGFRQTHTSADYLLAGRQMHPFVMALSYAATFISTSAIVGFGGVAGLFGMSLLWLVVLNIAVGIFIAFVVLGGPIRRMGHHLGAHTLPELLGRRFQSKFVQVFAGLITFLFMPLYATAVLLGGAEFLKTIFHMTSFDAALLIMALIIGIYVLAGGLKGVMYNDALQAAIMIIGMVLLLVLTYAKLGGVVQAHETLTGMADKVPPPLQAIGHQGWTHMPDFGWGDTRHNLWWITISTITLGVGIGVLAQPQMAMRFMTVRSWREINRAVGVGGVAILFLTGVAFTVGSLSNVFFLNHEEVRGKIITRSEEDKVLLVQPEGTSNEEAILRIPFGPATEVTREGGVDVIKPHLIAIARTGGKVDQIIPTYIDRAMPRWFGVLFLLTLVSAAMSTLSSQFHAMGTAIGRDVTEQLLPGYTASDKSTLLIVRGGILVGLVASLILAKLALRDAIAVATALFFGLCAASFLPTLVGGLFWKRMTPMGARVSMVGGFCMSMFWMLFMFEKTAAALGLCKALTGKAVLVSAPNWPVVDPMVVSLPVGIVLAVVVSLLTRPVPAEHLERCYK